MNIDDYIRHRALINLVSAVLGLIVYVAFVLGLVYAAVRVVKWAWQ